MAKVRSESWRFGSSVKPSGEVVDQSVRDHNECRQQPSSMYR